MLTTQYISQDVRALTLSNTIADAKKLFSELIFTHIPVVENGEFFGLISETDILAFDNTNKTINDIRFSLPSFFVYDETVWLDLIKIFSINDANIIPVLNKNNKYLGYYELSDILHLLSNTPFLQELGNVLVISKHNTAYSISEVSQIVESNSAKLHGVFVSGTENEDVILTVKLYCDNINNVIHTFRRYDYKIILGVKEDEYLDDLKNRSNYLQKYLSI